jgi:hypothetical protein
MTQETVSLAATTAVLGVIKPDAHTAGTYTTGWISAAQYQEFMAIVMAGDLGSSATLDASIQQATNSSGTGAKALTGSAITQLTQAGTDSNKQAIVAFSSDDLDLANGFTHFRLSMVVAVAASDAGAIVLGSDGRFGPASRYDATTVDEIVIV